MRILVTGSNRGLGFALVDLALSEGHEVIATYRSEKGLLEDIENDRLQVVKCDVTDEASVKTLKEEIKAYDSLDVIINNAGILNERETDIRNLDLDKTALAFEVNTLGPIRVVKHLLNKLLESDAKKIINISSEAGSLTHSYAKDYPYGMSKVALNMFSEKLHHELKDQGVEVYSVHPGWMQTDMGGKQAPLPPEGAAKTIFDAFVNSSKRGEHRFFNYDGRLRDL